MAAPRPTPRGRYLGLTGAALLGAGVLTAHTFAIQVGLLLVLAVLLGVVTLTTATATSRRLPLTVERELTPPVMHVGEQGRARVRLVSTSGLARFERLRLLERADPTLCEDGVPDTHVERGRREITLTYPVRPTRRGRWTIGPLDLIQTDPFGLVVGSATLREALEVRVRPQVVTLDVVDAVASHEAEQATSGLPRPAMDDAALRPYRSGDDLRRVHWPTTARRGALLVRQDEQTGRRSSSVVLDLDTDDATTEWTIRTGTSIALSLLGTGHHTRVLGGGGLQDDPRTDHHLPGTDEHAREALLDHATDLQAPRGPEEAERWLHAALETLTGDPGGTELVVAILAVPSAATLRSLALLGESGRSWAMVRAGTGADEAVVSLRRAGWTAAVVAVDEHPSSAWSHLMASPVGSAR